MRQVGIWGVLAVIGCHGGDGAPAGIVPITWHTPGDDGMPVAIGADGVVSDSCGEIGRYDRAAGTVRVTRGRPQTISMKEVSIEGDRVKLGPMDPFEVRGGHVMRNDDDWGVLDGDDGTADARMSFAALATASAFGPCHPPMSLAVAGGNHVLAMRPDGTIVDGSAPVATSDEGHVSSPSGAHFGYLHRDATERDCAEPGLERGPYQYVPVAIALGAGGAVTLVGGKPIGTLTGYHPSRRARGSAYALAVVALATLVPEPKYNDPPTAEHCP